MFKRGAVSSSNEKCGQCDNGYTLERVAYRPLRRAPRLAPLITAIGLSIILQHLAMIIWSRSPLAFPQIVLFLPIEFGYVPGS